MEQKTELIIKSLCILILTGLIVAIYINGKSLDCNKCILKFKSFKPDHIKPENEIYQSFNISINELYSTFLENRCILEFDKDNGFYLKNEYNIYK